jgi:ABC-type Fe3+/spermidine/putrescine transport system ATPase subunit
MEVKVENLFKSYGKVAALRDVSLSFVDGGLTAILGPSGCGKTTLLRCIAVSNRIQAPLPWPDDDRYPLRRGTAMVFQNYALWPHMSIFDNVAYGLRLKGHRDEIKARRRGVPISK